MSAGGRTPLTIDDPNFTVRELKSNAVLRCEYRPGSTLFFVWARARHEELPKADFAIGRQARELLSADGTNGLLVKTSHWLAR